MKKIYLSFIILGCVACSQKQNKPKETDTTNADTLVYVDTLPILNEDSAIIEKIAFVQSLEDQGLTNIQSLDPTIQVELKYATTDNFTKGVLYDDLKDAYLHPIAANKLVTAQKLLKEINDSLSLHIYDAVRPLSIQRKMYKVVQNTPYSKYVANPDRTGLHNYGIAVDLTICDINGIPLDMGTPFDFFGRKAGISEEETLIAEGKLTRKQVNNRKLLRRVMTEAGFLTIRGEWWHFNALPLSEAKKKAMLIDL